MLQLVSYFERPNRRGGREEEEEEKRRRKGDQKGMDSMIFGMDITWKVRILWFCMEF